MQLSFFCCLNLFSNVFVNDIGLRRLRISLSGRYYMWLRDWLGVGFFIQCPHWLSVAWPIVLLSKLSTCPLRAPLMNLVVDFFCCSDKEEAGT